MAMEITQVFQGSQPTRSDGSRAASAHTRELIASQQQADQQRRQLTKEQIERYTNELREVSRALNKRLSFNYNEELGLMVVKVIDGNTDKVIKELPPSELQRVHMRIREAIGLLLDESA
jgi:flagellar protein FlaG